LQQDEATKLHTDTFNNNKQKMLFVTNYQTSSDI